MYIDLRSALSRVEELCCAQGVDCLLTRNPSNIRYLTGCVVDSPGDIVLLVLSDHVLLFADKRYEGTLRRIEEENPLIGVHIWEDPDSWDDVMNSVGGGVLGFEENSPFSSYMFAQELIETGQKQGTTVLGVGDIIERVRIIKTLAEIAVLKKASAIADTVFEGILGQIKPGVTELELCQKLGRDLREQSGSEDLSFATIVASGPNGNTPHAKPGNRPLEKGDLITLDFGCVCDGYHSDTTRTVSIGEPSAELRLIYEIVLAAQSEAEHKARPGMTGQAVDRIARDVITAAGYGEFFGHGTGHGIGLDEHERPYVTYKDRGSNILEPGMTFSLEPGIYLECGGVRIENIGVLTSGGFVPFNQSLKELFIL